MMPRIVILLARLPVLACLAVLSFTACESETTTNVLSVVPSSSGTIAFLDEPGNEIHLKARVMWDTACSQRFQVIADSSDPRFAGLAFLEFQIASQIGTADRTFITRRHSGDSVRIWQSRSGYMSVTSIDHKKKTVSGGMHVFFPGSTPPETIYYTWGSFTDLPYEGEQRHDSSIQFFYNYQDWISNVSTMTVFDDSVTLEANACGFSALDQVHITLAHPDTGVFALDAFTYVSFSAIPEGVPGQSSVREQFSTVLTRKEDAGTIRITKFDLSRNIIEGTFSIKATSPSGRKIALKQGIVSYGVR